MTKSEISRKVAGRFGLSERDATGIVKLITDSMREAVSSGSRVEIRGFGSFYTRDCEPYTGINPRTGEKVFVKAKKLPCFRQGKELRDFFRQMSERESV